MNENKLYLELDWRLSTLLNEVEGKKDELMGMDRVQLVGLLHKAHTIDRMVRRAMSDGASKAMVSKKGKSGGVE